MVMDLDQELAKQIEEICAARGVRLTPQRKRVFELICASPKASSAYELLEQLKVSQPTVLFNVARVTHINIIRIC